MKSKTIFNQLSQTSMIGIVHYVVVVLAFVFYKLDFFALHKGEITSKIQKAYVFALLRFRFYKSGTCPSSVFKFSLMIIF